jgi:predicted RNase H-like HicB family nuclease
MAGAAYTEDETNVQAVSTAMKTYSFKVVVEPDEDRWHAFCPALEERGASTWGRTREEALKHIDEVVQLVVDSMIEHDEKLPEESTEDVQVTVEPRVTVNV